MANQEVISNILDLLEIMEEGIAYIKKRIRELNMEATVTVLSNTIDAFSTIETAMIPMLDKLEENQIIEKTEILKEKFNILVKEYEKGSGQKFSEIMELSVEPAFTDWKKEIELVLRPYIAS